jgi:hypothetical protein
MQVQSPPLAPVASTTPDLPAVARQARARARKYYRWAAWWERHALVWAGINSAEAVLDHERAERCRGWAREDERFARHVTADLIG